MSNAGAPKKDLSILPDNWYNQVLDLYGDGGSDVEVKAMIYDWAGTFSNSLWIRWMKEEEQFSQTIKMGKVLSEAWWAKNGRTNLTNREFNYTGWYMNMKNRFGWKDKNEVEQTIKSTGHIIQTEPMSMEDWQKMGKESQEMIVKAQEQLMGDNK